MDGPAKPVFLTRCPSTFEADATLALLRSFDIPCFSQPDSGAEKVYTGMSLTGESIFVEHAQLAQANEILRGFRKGCGQVDETDRDALLAQSADVEPGDEGTPRLLSRAALRNVLLILFLINLAFFFLMRSMH